MAEQHGCFTVGVATKSMGAATKLHFSCVLPIQRVFFYHTSQSSNSEAIGFHISTPAVIQ